MYFDGFLFLVEIINIVIENIVIFLNITKQSDCAIKFILNVIKLNNFDVVYKLVLKWVWLDNRRKCHWRVESIWDDEK